MDYKKILLALSFLLIPFLVMAYSGGLSGYQDGISRGFADGRFVNDTGDTMTGTLTNESNLQTKGILVSTTEGTTNFFISPTGGNIGIGTNNPLYDIHLIRDIDNQILNAFCNSNSGTQAATALLLGYTSNFNYSGAFGYTNPGYVAPAGQELLKAGTFFIGVNPGGTRILLDNTNASGDILFTIGGYSTANEIARITSAGLMIGTTEAIADLTIAGDTFITGTLTVEAGISCEALNLGLVTTSETLNRVRINNPDITTQSNAVINLGGEYDGSAAWLGYPVDTFSGQIVAQARDDGTASFYAGIGGLADARRDGSEKIGMYGIAYGTGEAGVGTIGVYGGGGMATEEIQACISAQGYAETALNADQLGTGNIFVSRTNSIPKFTVTNDGSLITIGTIESTGTIETQADLIIVGNTSMTGTLAVSNEVHIATGANNATGLTFGSLGTATKAIDFSGSGLSGATDYWLYGDANNWWRADGDVTISGTNVRFGGSLFLLDNQALILGTSENSAIFYGAQATEANMVIAVALPSENLMLIGSFANLAVGDDYQHPNQSNPTLFIHSATSAGSATDEWISLTHDTNNGVIGVGTGVLSIEGDGLTVSGTIETQADLIVTGNTSMTGTLEIQNDLIFSGAGSGIPYGEIYGHNLDYPVTMEAQDTWYKFAGFDKNGINNLTTLNTFESNILVDYSGVYEVAMHASVNCSSVEDFQIGVWKNNGATQLECLDAHVTTAVGNKNTTIGANCLAPLTAGDSLEVWAIRTTGAGIEKTLMFEHCALNVKMIGGQ